MSKVHFLIKILIICQNEYQLVVIFGPFFNEKSKYKDFGRIEKWKNHGNELALHSCAH